MTLKTALKRVKNCNGDCKPCQHLQIPAATCMDSDSSYYAFVCGIGDKAGMQIMTNRLRDLKAETIDGLEFELS